MGRLAAIGAALLAYALLFPQIHRAVGSVAPALGVFAPVLTGLLLGWRWGAAAGLACMPLNVYLLARVGDGAFSPAGHAAGTLAFTAIGAVVGRLHGMGVLLRRSHADLERALGEARQAQRALAEREAQLAQAQALAHIGYWVLDLETQVMTWSTELCRIAGVDPAGVQPSLEAWFQHIHPEDRARLERSGPRAVAGGEPFREEFRIVRADGKVRWAYGRVQALRDEAGKPVKLLGTVQDLTEHRELEAKLTTAERLATVGTLAAGVAHEINNPLAYVINNMEYVREELRQVASALPQDAGDELMAAAGEALQGADRVRRIVRDLMAFSVPDHHPGPVDVERVLDLSVNMAASEIRYRARVVKQYGGVPPVSGNASRLGQVFLNLIVNAAQAIPPGEPDRHEIRLTTRLEEDQIIVSVRDSGLGMTPEVKRRIFEPFFTTKPLGAGMGLGLSTSLGIIRSLGGDIVVESEPGRGSVFTVNLLATRSPAEVPPEAAPG